MSGSTSYTVNARLQITGNAQQALRDVASALSRVSSRLPGIEQGVNRLIARFATLGMSGNAALTGLNTQATQLRGTMLQLGLSGNTLGRSFTAMGSGITNAMRPAASAIQAAGAAASGANRSASALANNVGRLATNATNATTAMQRLSQVPPPRNIPPQARTTGSGSGGGRGGGTHSTLSEAAGTSAVGSMAATGIGAVVTAGGELQQAATMVRARQFAPEEQAQMRAAAEDISRRVPGVSIATALRSVSDMTATIPDVGRAIAATEPLLRAAAVAAIQTDKPIEQVADTLTRMMAIRGSWVDEQGNLTPERGLRETQMLTNTMIAMGSRFNPTEMLNAFQQMGAMGKTMSPEMLFQFLPSLVSEIRGFRTGTAIAALNRQFGAGIMPKRVFDEMTELGLYARNTRQTAMSDKEVDDLVDKGLVSSDEDIAALKAGQQVRVGNRALRGQALFNQNPFLWFEQVLRPLLRERGIVDPQDQLAVLNRISGTDVVRRVFTQMMGGPEFWIDQRNIARVQATGEGATNTVLTEGWDAGLKNLKSSWDSMLQLMGESMATELVPRMHELGAGLRSIGDAAKANPELTSWLMGLGVAIAGLGVAGATFAIGSLAISGLGAMGAGILALGAAITPVGWALIFAALVGGLVNLAAKMDIDWGSLFSRLTAALGGLYDRARVFLGLQPGGGREGGHGADPNTLQFDPSSGQPIAVPHEMPAAPPPSVPRPLGPLEQVEPPASWNPPDPRRSSYIPMAPTGDGETSINTAVYLDGRQIAEVVSKHQADQAGRSTAASNRFDPRRGMWPAESLAGMA